MIKNVLILWLEIPNFIKHKSNIHDCSNCSRVPFYIYCNQFTYQTKKLLCHFCSNRFADESQNQFARYLTKLPHFNPKLSLSSGNGRFIVSGSLSNSTVAQNYVVRIINSQTRNSGNIIVTYSNAISVPPTNDLAE